MANRNRNKNKNNKLVDLQAERNNFQDAAEEREYNKGKAAGSNKARKNFRKNDRNKSNNKFKGNDLINNVDWYVPNATLLKNVASIPFGRITGYPLLDMDFSTFPTLTENYAVPGVMALQIIPTFGPTSNAGISTSPLNLSAQSLFSYTRHANSGAANYESNDEMLYILAVSNVISYFSFLVRAYGIASNFSIMNKYTPEALITSMGINYQDLQSNYPVLRAAINLLAYRLQTLVIPKGIHYVDRQVFIYENVYTDADNAKAQYYIFVPVGFYQYTEGSGTDPASYLQFKPLVKSNPSADTANLLTVAELIAYANDLVDPILGSQDFNEIIAGDILKAFGSENTYSVPSISEDYQVMPQYNKEILTQIENAVIYDGTVSTLLRDEYSDYMPTVKQSSVVNSSTLVPTIELPLFPRYSGIANENSWYQNVYRNLTFNDYVMNFHEDTVSPEMVMVGSRLMSGDISYTRNIGLTNPASVDLFIVNNCGSEIVFNAAIFWFNKTQTNPQLHLTVTSFARFDTSVGFFSGTATAPAVTMGEITAATQNMTELAFKLCLISKFDWAPRVTPITGSMITSGRGTFIGDALWDLDNFAELSEEQMLDINTIAITGLLTCYFGE